jgi:GntR family transcriptional regulator of vanillate catabolism
VSTRSLEVTRAIRNGILHGHYPGGMRMNEIDLAAALGVSRTPIRGALSTLAAEGLLDYTPNSGYLVRRFSGKDIADIYTVRAALDGMAAGLAAELGLAGAARISMTAILDESERFIRAGSSGDDLKERWRCLNTRFHDVIYRACNNDFLVGLLRRATDMPHVSHTRFHAFDTQALQQAHDDHCEIADAILNRQRKRAEALGTEHVYRAGRRMVTLWQQAERRASLGGDVTEIDPAAVPN